ncbi:unnamed protein product [Protopolystoma xenopodis]|uniref:Uncharacterized protein n=1 Tax=Protopolystoma xenopodis TaxID=117903 RepID=A0A448WZ76_9PLAT|nr:unnamed protein product [Protopolystoma xenopodis]
MAALTDDAGETFENVPSQLSDAGSDDNYYGRGLWTRCVLLRLPDYKTKLPLVCLVLLRSRSKAHA